jgi:hypothetical protein
VRHLAPKASAACQHPLLRFDWPKQGLAEEPAAAGQIGLRAQNEKAELPPAKMQRF